MSRPFPELVMDIERLPPGTAIDGELVMLDEHGHPQFDRLLGRTAISRPDVIRRASRERPGAIVAWDVLAYAGEDCRPLPLLERKRILQRALKDLNRITYAGHMETDGQLMYDAAVALALEGVVAKRADSPYTAGRTTDWVKIKTPIGREREASRMEQLRR
jgi:bifunctional non-homologous end joining protein LigD